MGKIMVCDSCKEHPFQDRKYGKKKRVFNQTRTGEGSVYRCTVCSHEQSGK